MRIQFPVNPMCRSRGVTGGLDPPPPPPQKNHKNIEFLCNISLDPLKNHEATKPAFNVGPLSTRRRNAIKMAFRWLANDDPLLVLFGSSLPLSIHQKKNCQSTNPSCKTSGSTHESNGAVSLLILFYLKDEKQSGS